MKTVIRNAEGYIEWILYTGRTYLTKNSLELVMGAEVTPEMVNKYTSQADVKLCELLNEEGDHRLLKISVLRANGYLIDSKTV